MLELENLSPIGFGSYRVSINNEEHYKSLFLALESGCNLIDTASNYCDGDSELLVGKVLGNWGKDVFVITKAGYIQGRDLALYNQKWPDRINFNENFSYCLDVDFLDRQLKKSLIRMGRKHVDGFLLHNPEHYFNSPLYAHDKDRIYDIIKNAFEYLEDQVRMKTIRYYGISSNSIPFQSSLPSTLSLTKLLEIAGLISSNHHFKLVQFPYNITENDAVKDHEGGKSLIQICQDQKIVSLGNRPLNCKVEDGVLRLAQYKECEDLADETGDQVIAEQIFDLIRIRLKEIGMEDQWEEFEVLTILQKNWNKFGNTEAVERIFLEHFWPFLNSLFEEIRMNEVSKSFNQFFEKAKMYSRISMSRRAFETECELIAQGTISASLEPLTYKVCNYYLDQGLSHVLVGMRKPKYVKDFIGGF